jgi:hypothetical protein
MITRRSLLISSVGALGATLVSLAAGAEESRVRLAIVMAKNSPVTGLSLFELKRLFMGEPVNAGGQKLIPLNLPPLSKDRVGFDQAVLGLTPDAVARYWIDRKIRGESPAPKAIASPDLLQRVVNHLDGAIGYVRSAEVSDDVKIIRIDGKTPSENGYPIEF